MRTLTLTLALLLSAAALADAPFADEAPADDAVSALYLRGGELAVRDAGGAARTLTRDGAVKYLPAWSQDGSRIAYLRAIDRSRGLAELVVIDRAGAPVDVLTVRPADGDPELMTLMRFVETLQWVGPGRIALSGSINPSTVETVVIDLAARAEVAGFLADGWSGAFSADGRHFAAITGNPHFTPESGRRPQLEADGRRLYPGTGGNVRFLSAPAWSADARHVAVVARDAASPARELVVAAADGSAVRRHALAGAASADWSVHWDGGEAVAAAAKSAWRTTGAGGGIEPLDVARATAALRGAEALRAQWRNRIVDGGGSQVDPWCGGCALALLPRRVSLAD